jgi:heptosyltransferase-2
MRPAPDDIIICGPNWLGDSIMCMPAIQAYKKNHPTCCIRILVKPHLQSLWEMHSDVESVLLLGGGLQGMHRAVRSIRSQATRLAFIFPNSFRSALVPFLAHVDERIGRPGHRPTTMLTRVIPPGSRESHQACEYLQIMGLNHDDVPLPRLELQGEGANDEIGVTDGERAVGIMPGAAYGPSKRWPAHRFIAVGRLLADDHGCRVLVFGNKDETQLCEKVAAGIGQRAINMGGKTSIPRLATMLHKCSLVICNDSGGMHLAAAVRTPVVAVFGVTDPTKTGPIGDHHRLVYRTDVPHSRELGRNSKEAMSVLSSIHDGEVSHVAVEILKGQDGS